MQGLTIRKLADKSGGRLYDQDGNPLEPWPLAGVQFEGDPPDEARVSTTIIDNGRAEGWISLEDENVVTRPAGPHDDPWRGDPHVFRHAGTVVFHMIDGDHRYTVVANPDKEHANREDKAGEVSWFYDLKREKTRG